MQRRRATIPVLIALLGLVLALALSQRNQPSAPIALGEEAPTAAFASPDGRSLSFKDFRGQVVLVHFWATWCPPCREEFPWLIALKQLFGQEPLTILAFSVDDSWDVVHEFMGLQAGTLPVYADFQQKLARRFGTSIFPETYVLDKQGIVRMKMIGTADWTAPSILASLRQLVDAP
jgi:cytochrome c biogenesis protein CcmG/thiol:disulfide interchange protein DsbE